jgi:hypothetical protein
LVANDVLNWRNSDRASNPALYTPVGSVGYWATIDSLNQAAELPGWGNVGIFAIAGTAGYIGSLGMSNPDYLTTNTYATDYNTVKTRGSASVPLNVRSAAQTDTTFFWNSAAGTITNAGLCNGVAKSVVAYGDLNLADVERLYAA